MTKENGIYKCEICGNIISVIEAHNGELVCCGQPMGLMEEKTTEQEGNEKHVPIIESTDTGIKIKVGSIEHPMEENHSIELIQVIKDGKVIAGKRLKPGEKPEIEFCMVKAEGITARAVCNIHGVWIN